MTIYVELPTMRNGDRWHIIHDPFNGPRTLCGAQVPREKLMQTEHPEGRVCTQCELTNMRGECDDKRKDEWP